MNILKTHKKGRVNGATLGFLAIIAILIIGTAVLYFQQKDKNKQIKPTTQQTQNIHTKTVATSAAVLSNENKVTPEVLKKMQQGYTDGSLGAISPIPNWYNPSEIAPGQNMITSALSYSVPANKIADMVAGNSNSTQKEVFLTFDDGPSVQNTPAILNILKENDVHATFFLIGNHMQNNAEVQNIVRQEIMDGNAIGDHTYDHELTQLYPNNKIDVNEFMHQMNECEQMEQAILGPNFDTKIVRLPGGYMSRVHYNDPNLPAFNKALDNGNWTVVDWTADSGVAATTHEISPEKMLEVSTKGWQDMPQDVLLMHDAGAKTDTVTGLPGVINFFKDHGYKFMVIGNAPASSFDNLPYTDVKTDSNQGQSQAVLNATKKAVATKTA